MVFSQIQGIEWVLILLIVLLIFGPSKLPQLARGIGQAIHEFRKASRGLTEEETTTRRRGELERIDEETLLKLARKLGIEDAEKKEKKELISEIIAEAKKKGILDKLEVEGSKS